MSLYWSTQSRLKLLIYLKKRIHLGLHTQNSKFLKPLTQHTRIKAFSSRSFSKPFVPQTYSYPDYIKAWYKVMWFSIRNHSWFISFCLNAHKINFPLWFIRWWNNFGLTNDILPTPIQESYFFFSRTIQKNSFHNLMRLYLYF